MPSVSGFLTSPSMASVQGRVRKDPARAAGSALSVPNS